MNAASAKQESQRAMRGSPQSHRMHQQALRALDKRGANGPRARAKGVNGEAAARSEGKRAGGVAGPRAAHTAL